MKHYTILNQNLRKTKRPQKCMGTRSTTAPKRKEGTSSVYIIQPTQVDMTRWDGISASRETVPGNGICIIKSNEFRQHY